MRKSKRISATVKLLIKNSLNNGQVDVKKAANIVKALMHSKIPNLLNVLRLYKKRLQIQISKEEVYIETATKLSGMEKDILGKTGAKRIIYKLNPQMIAGIKIKHGDWVWEESLDSKLTQITQSPNNLTT